MYNYYWSEWIRPCARWKPKMTASCFTETLYDYLIKNSTSNALLWLYAGSSDQALAQIWDFWNRHLATAFIMHEFWCFVHLFEYGGNNGSGREVETRSGTVSYWETPGELRHRFTVWQETHCLLCSRIWSASIFNTVSSY